MFRFGSTLTAGGGGLRIDIRAEYPAVGVYIQSNGMVGWNSGMDYWNDGMLHRMYLIIQHVLYSEQ